LPPERTTSLSVAVVCWDLGHNALGRAHLLADMLSADHDVEIVGSHFPEFGAELWAPLRDTGIPVRRYPGGPFPGYFPTMERMARDLTADVVYVVKPRLPGLGVGMLAKADPGRPLVVDCDDLELSFVGGRHGLSLAELEGLRDEPDFVRPQGRTWTSFSEWAVRLADAVTVCNVPLAARYGGTVVPHARDERVFDPELYDREEARARLGLTAEHRAVLFAGTPRRHKGIQQIAAALERIGDRRNRLCVLATRELDELRPHIAGLEEWVHPVTPEPFSRLPQLLAAADAVCLLQDPASETARWQTPAKVSDALAMGVPCLTTRTPPLLPLIEEGGVIPVTEDDLDLRLEGMLADAGARAEQASRGREIFLRRFSYSAVRPRLTEVLRKAAADDRPPAAELLATVSFQRSQFTHPPAAPARDPDAVTATVSPGAGPVVASIPADGGRVPLTREARVSGPARPRRPGRPETVLAVVPYLGWERGLDRCLESLVGQTRPPDRIVVVDDGSPEPPVGAVRRFPGVTLLRSGRSVGPDRLVRRVIEETAADWYLLQDADGWSAGDRLERLLAVACDSGAELVGSHYVTAVPDEGLTISHTLPADVNAALDSSPSGRALHHPTSLVHRRLVERLDAGPPAPWFSGSQDLLRRAAGVARVVNVARVLCFERPGPGLGLGPSPGDGDQAAPTSFEHLWGPPLDRPPPRRVVSSTLRRAVRRFAAGPSRRPAPTLVVGGPASGADTLLWSLAQHPSLVAQLDLSWCPPAVEVLERAADGAGATPDAVRRALAAAMGGVVTDRRRGASAWLALVPPAPALIRAVLALYPNARIVHVVRDADETATVLSRKSLALPEPIPLTDAYRTWLDGVQNGLECERLVGGSSVLRVRFDELVSHPGEVLARCLRFLHLGEHPACGRLLDGSAVVRPAVADTGPTQAAGADARDLSTALCGPPRISRPAVRAAPAAPVRSDPPRPVPVVESPTPAPSLPPPLPAHVAGPAALLRRNVSAGAVVAVVTKGEGRFLELEHVKACHFPQTAWGEWAGFHPADTAEIVTQLRDLLRRGARYFLIPPFAAWWLDHYEGLREHLLASASLVAESPEAGTLFELGAEPVEPAVGPAAAPAVAQLPERRSPRPRTGSAADGFDVVMFWKQHDTGLYGRRHDMLMKHLARSPRVGQVVQFDAPVDLASLRRRDPEVPTHHSLLEKLAMARVGGVEAVPGLHQHSFVYGGGRSSDRAFPTRDEYDVYVKDALARHRVGERPVVFWVYPKNFEFPEIARAFGPDLIVADVVDDHRTWLQAGGGEEARVLGNYETIARSADLVLVNCESMQELMATMATNVHLVPNAADYPDPLAKGPLEIPDDLRDLQGPIVGYVGNLSSRIDVELLDRLAGERPDWNLVLIGSAHAGRGIAPLARHRNVSLLGPRPYEEAKRYIRAFDVALIPHLDDPMTRAMNPLKAFVYCALQVPVVSTNIANLGELGPLVSVASDHDDFIAKVDAAIQAGRGPLDPAADAVLRRNSWESRIKVITDLVGDALRQKADR
jgi:glycosyltransferase involved in cell wall biosynthesis